MLVVDLLHEFELGVWKAVLSVMIRTPEGPYFSFLSRPLSFSHPLTHLLPFSPTVSRALLTICSIFPTSHERLAFPGSTYPRLYLVRIPALVIVA